MALLPRGDSPAACGDGERVEITVVAVLAHDKDDKVHPKLKCLAPEVKKKDPKLTGLRLGKTSCKSLALGGSETFPLVDGKEATIEVKRCSEDPTRFCLKVKAPSLVGEITYSVVCGKYMPFDTKYVTKKEGERLFLAIMVQPCPAKKGK